MRGIFVHRELTRVADDRPEVVEAIAGSRTYRVVAARDTDYGSVSEQHGAFGAVAFVQSLEPESFGPVEAVVVHLLERGLAICTVVFVRRVRRPLTWLVERLADQEV